MMWEQMKKILDEASVENKRIQGELEKLYELHKSGELSRYDSAQKVYDLLAQSIFNTDMVIKKLNK